MGDRQFIDRNWEELQARMERHRRLVFSVLEGRGEHESECLWDDCPHRRALMGLALETVRVLDETRKAFKSKQLEGLRKDLLRVLAEEVRGGRPAGKAVRE